MTPPSRSRSAFKRCNWRSSSCRLGSSAPSSTSASFRQLSGAISERLADAAGVLLAARARGLELGFDARARLAGLTDGGLCGPQRLGCRTQAVVGGSELVGGGLALPLRVRKLVQQLLALFVDELGKVVVGLQLGFGLDEARAQGRDLLVRCCGAGRPPVALGPRTGVAFGTGAGLAFQARQPGTRVHHRAPCGRSGGLGGFELRLDILVLDQKVERRFHFGQALVRVEQVFLRPLTRLGHGGKSRLCFAGRALDDRQLLAQLRKPGLGVAPALA